jgi:hypothetical protein
VTRTDIVVTTIFEPAWMEGYLSNIRDHGRVDEVVLRIICDRKTPASVYAAAESASRAGFTVDCPTLEEQAAYLRAIGVADDFIPWNTDNRRNVGFLRAWEHGAEVLVSIDDDNYCRPGDDFVGAHQVVGQPAGSLAGFRVADGGPWFNICELLEPETDGPLYPRGFPYSARSAAARAELGPATGRSAARVVANAGLWVGDPDVDAVTRLALAPRIRGASSDAVLLGPATWSPVNTQNTAVARDAIPAYWYVRMGFALQGMTIDRFGDILSGYFLQKCAKHLGDTIRLGSPVAEHHRTPHDSFRDLHAELPGMVLLEGLLPWLREVPLSGDSYADAYASLAAALREEARRFTGFVWDEGGREFLVETADGMQDWLDVVSRVGLT